jgi:hypothetical protein
MLLRSLNASSYHSHRNFHFDTSAVPLELERERLHASSHYRCKCLIIDAQLCPSNSLLGEEGAEALFDHLLRPKMSSNNSNQSKKDLQHWFRT